MAGRFKLITDEHWSKAHVKAAREAGWEVVRVVDILGQQTKDSGILAYCEQQGYVWVTSDKRSQPEITDWIKSGQDAAGCHHRRGAPQADHAWTVSTLPSRARRRGCTLRGHHPLRDARGEVGS